MSDKQITTKLQLAQKSSNLSLSSFNLFKIPEKVFTITTLTRLDLSNNNIELIPPTISSLTKLKQLWANQNPIRSIPPEVSKCTSLESIDFSNTLITNLPRELALIHKLNEIKLNNCPLIEPLQFCYTEGTTSVWKYLQRKVDRKKYKEEVFRRLREGIYPGEDPRQIMELTLSIFKCLKSVDTPALKLLVHNMNRIFPEKINYANPDRIKEKIEEIMSDLQNREELSELTLKLKSRYPQEDLPKVANMALTLSQNYNKEELGVIFRRKLLPENFIDMELPAISMSLTSMKEKKEHEWDRAKLALFSKLKGVYGDGENLEKLQGMAEELGSYFESPEEIRRFIRAAKDYLPSSSAEFDSEGISQNFKSGNSIIH